MTMSHTTSIFQLTQPPQASEVRFWRQNWHSHVFFWTHSQYSHESSLRSLIDRLGRGWGAVAIGTYRAKRGAGTRLQLAPLPRVTAVPRLSSL